jgi:hypothetical protein
VADTDHGSSQTSLLVVWQGTGKGWSELVKMCQELLGALCCLREREKREKEGGKERKGDSDGDAWSV